MFKNFVDDMDEEELNKPAYRLHLDRDDQPNEGSIDEVLGRFTENNQSDNPYFNEDLAGFDAYQPPLEEVSEDEEQEPEGDLNIDEKEVKELLESSKQLEDDLKDIDTSDMVKLYIKEATRVSLLTAEEEVELSQRIERGRLAQQELVRGKISKSRLNELRSLIRNGQEASERLIQANALLVISVAKKYIGRNVPFLDLIQEGNIGLMRAAKKFDYHRGYKFSTYATWWIRQAITRALSDQSRTIRLPAYLGDQVNRMLREQHQMQQKLGRLPTVVELAEEMQLAPDKVTRMLKAIQQPLSLQMSINEDEDEVLGDLIPDNSMPNPEDSATSLLLSEDLKEVLAQLPTRELHVLQMRYGLIDGEGMTLNEVGRRLGISRERARQIEAQALRRLRSTDTHRKLYAYSE